MKIILLEETPSYQEQRQFNHRDYQVHGGKQSFHQLNYSEFLLIFHLTVILI